MRRFLRDQRGNIAITFALAAFPLAGARFTVSTQCAPEGIRTPNLLIRSQMLYPLSYER